MMNFDPTGQPLTIVMNASTVVNNVPYIAIKMENGSVIVDFYQDGKIVRTFRKTYTEMWEEAE